MNATVNLDALFAAMKADYLAWFGRGELSDHAKGMIEEYNNSLRFVEGKKYIKVIKGGSVWGFVVIDPLDPKFKVGDILKPAGWATPTRNFSRGNVGGDLSCIKWTGA